MSTYLFLNLLSNTKLQDEIRFGAPEPRRHIDCRYGSQPWFVNVSSAAHVHHRSRNLGSPLVFAMQPLSASYFLPDTNEGAAPCPWNKKQ